MSDLEKRVETLEIELENIRVSFDERITELETRLIDLENSSSKMLTKIFALLHWIVDYLLKKLAPEGD